ncbi:carbamoyltransferase [Modestobacter sp. I12A-02628]|uniref:Carbamoyltransferase n=1 Tax=Goekera deserti TaxID=2497753 RepID=A0A7K3WEM5_9ACTN|nr:carbamoyltransferase C-terminal domain-containing protein [Goekera deserti]MPQ96897.1 carbamoyltransferase [Goekera deserti]NDI46790.1 carbamoyltransferase [Goekera deserti]NEL54359.1 carbamoyltransferase [Goekera deserti]
MIVVGISAHYHDAACAIFLDGRLVAAAQEERFTRRRYDATIPARALRACLHEIGAGIGDVEHVAYYEDPVARCDRILSAGTPSAMPPDAGRPLREIRDRLGYAGPVTTVRHHEAHAASAFYCSGFPDAAVLTADAVGEWATTSYGSAGPEGISTFEEVRFPHSLGLLYSTLTAYLGFEVNSDENKVMGLAPYGRPTFVAALSELIHQLPEGQFELDARYFDFTDPSRMYTDALSDVLGIPPRPPDAPTEGAHTDVARSLQVVLEDVLLEKARHLFRVTGNPRLCYAGGVALNCVANARIRQDGPFAEMFVQPAAGDAGGSIGAAALAHHRLTGGFRAERLVDARLGPSYDTTELAHALQAAGVPFSDHCDDQHGPISQTADMLAAGAVVGWYQGRMEFGPRALGARSILADPRDPGMRDRINDLVKKREAFRPFAPSVAAERTAEFFDFHGSSPFMLDTAQVRRPADLPAIAHVDGSARLQTVDAAVDPRFHALLTAFAARTGFPILLNTSFNLRGEPIVCTPGDALASFVRCGLDALVIGNLILRAADVPPFWASAVDQVAPIRPRGVSGDIYSFG